MDPPDTLHLLNPKCQQATERAGDSRSGEEDSDALRLLAALVLEGDVVCHTGEETGFCQAEEDACARLWVGKVRDLGGKRARGMDETHATRAWKDLTRDISVITIPHAT